MSERIPSCPHCGRQMQFVALDPIELNEPHTATFVCGCRTLLSIPWDSSEPAVERVGTQMFGNTDVIKVSDCSLYGPLRLESCG